MPVPAPVKLSILFKIGMYSICLQKWYQDTYKESSLFLLPPFQKVTWLVHPSLTLSEMYSYEWKKHAVIQRANLNQILLWCSKKKPNTLKQTLNFKQRWAHEKWKRIRLEDTCIKEGRRQLCSRVSVRCTPRYLHGDMIWTGVSLRVMCVRNFLFLLFTSK